MSENIVTQHDELIAKRLQVRRKLLGIPADTMASLLQMTPYDYHRLEAAQFRFSAKILFDLMFLLGVPLSFFFISKL